MNIDDLIKNVSSEYPKYIVEKQTKPTYVGMFSKNCEEIVIVYLKSKQSNSYESNNRRSTGNEKEELELTGSPLKLDLSLHTLLDETLPTDEPPMWTKEEALHSPVSLEIAREIANLYNHTSREKDFDESVLPMWIVCSPTIDQPILLLTAQSYKNHFARGIVKYEGTVLYGDLKIETFINEFVQQENLSSEMVAVTVDCKYSLSGMSYSSIAKNSDELLNAPHGSCSELYCEWNGSTLEIPVMTCKVLFEQEVIIGHLMSPCNNMFSSICALQTINLMLVDMTVAGVSSVNLDTCIIRRDIPGSKRYNNSKRLNQFLNEVEALAFMAQCPTGGCLCVTGDTNSLKQCLDLLETQGSSNDFTYMLWDILKDCDTASELISLMLQALTFVSTGNIRPFIDANNKTFLSKLVLKLSRGHSQSAKVLKNLKSNPQQVLSLIGQVGIEKTMWEYTHIMSLVEHSFFIAGIWNSDARSHETIEQINQTINDMTMSGGEFSLNPFESLSNTVEHSIRLDCESFYDDDPNELSVDEFASLKKHGLVSEKKAVNEVPLIADEIDVSPWKGLLMKFAQIHVCLEHLYRAEMCLRTDFASLKPLASRLLEHYVSEKSPVKTVGQLINDPVQEIALPINNNLIKDHVKKPVRWYRVEVSRKENAKDSMLKRDARQVHVLTQQPVFPPLIWQSLEPQSEEVAEMTTLGEELKYYCTKYIYINDRLPNKLSI